MSTRGRDGDGGARLLQFLYQKFVLANTQEGKLIVASLGLASNIPSILFIQNFLDSVDADCITARDDLLLVANSRPLHGRLGALRYMLECVDNTAEYVVSEGPRWRQLYSHIMESCKRVWNVISDVLRDDSPEGNLPDSIVAQNRQPLRGADAQVVLSFCWRALREVSNLLRVLMIQASCHGTSQLINEAEFKSAGELSLAWLTEVRHRGAFSAVFPNFVDICKRMLTIPDQKIINDMPKLWLDQSIDELSKSTHSKDITRRSGGLPMSIISLMVAEVESRSVDLPMSRKAMNRLIGLVLMPVENANDLTELPQVHAYNTLKDIFLESKLTACSTDYIEKCFVICIDGFSSPIWAIRNCALMLFSSLIRRSFSSRTARAESSTNTFSAAAFFLRYPAVLVRLTRELEDAVGALFSTSSPTIRSGLQPCLTLLSRLDRADSNELDDGDLEFETLIELISRIATCRIWQIRSIAALALPTFLDQELVGTFIIQQLSRATTADQNALHGRLLMIHHLLQYNLDKHMVDSLFVEQVLGDLRRAITNRFVEFTSENPSSTTEALWLKILFYLARTINMERNAVLRQRDVDYCSRELLVHTKKHREAVGNKERNEIMTGILLRALADPKFKHFQNSSVSSAISGLIADPRVEIRIHTYKNLHLNFSRSPTLKGSVLQMALEAQSLKETWPVARIAAQECIVNLPLSTHALDETVASAHLSIYTKELQAATLSSQSTDLTLQLTGRLIGSLKTFDIKDFIGILSRFAHERYSVDTRMAALKALATSHLLSFSVAEDDLERSSPVVSQILSLLLDFLCDDDEDIRKFASSKVCKHMLSCTTMTPERTRGELIVFCARRHPNLETLHDILLKEIVGDGHPEIELKRALHPSDLLFAIEKQNLWRNPVLNCSQALAGLSQISERPTLYSKLGQWTLQAFAGLREHIETCDADGALGWTSIADVWHIIRRILLVNKWLSASNCPPELKASLHEAALSIKEASIDKDVHPSLLSNLNFEQ